MFTFLLSRVLENHAAAVENIFRYSFQTVMAAKAWKLFVVFDLVIDFAVVLKDRGDFSDAKIASVT